ncbi:TetR/AcrR family transcriptional regulator [Mycolicibacterium anyangense]|jgi:AcrR family transcriptional regulator|uniref:TetR/AcrR family transcriptional regulator n=1 Tax=Mycolicibacterium anyangense TaxID=1431246 RepID=UPI0013D3561D|nr:TetR/AcrR family transcriptional regulator [Mycolicibacterium anyangense]
MSKKIDDRRKSPVDVQPPVSAPRWSSGRIRKSDLTRQRILEALEGLLATRSLDELSVNEVAAAAGVRRTGFYFYFPSKAVAVATLLDEVFDETFEGASQFMARSMDRPTALRVAIGHLWALWQQHRPLMLAVLDARSTDREAATIWERWLERHVAPVAGVVAADRAAGLAPEGPEPATLLRLLVSMNERTLERMLRADLTRAEAESELDALTSIWARAIYGTLTC